MSHRVRIGKWSSGVGSGYGMRVAQPGKDAESLDDRDLTFSSDWPAVLPVHQAGTFGLSPGTQVAVGFPDLGYVPFCFFLMNPTGAPSGTPSYAAVFQNGWNAYHDVAYMSASTGRSLKLRATGNQVLADYTLPSGNTQGWPSSWTIAYVVYRMRADL